MKSGSPFLWTWSFCKLEIHKFFAGNTLNIFLKLLSSISNTKNSLLNLPNKFEFLISVVATPLIILAPSTFEHTDLPDVFIVWNNKFVVVLFPFVPVTKNTFV